jgi:hypothetical protein
MSIKYRHELTKDALAALTAQASDTDIAQAIADYLLAARPAPFLLNLNHNAKAAPCPLRIDRPGIKASSYTCGALREAHTWIMDALLRGYEVSEGKGMNERGPCSIASEKRSIEYRGRRPMLSDDDEIPF